MSGTHLCIPRNETVQPPSFQNRMKMFCLLIPTLIYLWEIYIFPGSFCLFCCSQLCGHILGIYKSLTDKHMNVDWDWGRAIPRTVIHKWDFRCCVMQSDPWNLRACVPFFLLRIKLVFFLVKPSQRHYLKGMTNEIIDLFPVCKPYFLSV